MRLALSCVFAASIVVACSDDATSNGGATGGVSDATVQALAQAVCDRALQCSSDTIVQIAYGDIAACKARTLEAYTKVSKAPGFTFTDATIQQCITALPQATCDQVLGSDLPSICTPSGTLVDGASCIDDVQCVSGGCYIASGSSCGQCGARVAEGADCGSAKCLKGLFCNGLKKCVHVGTAGSACDDNAPCAPTLDCVKGNCVAPLGPDADCDVADDAVPCDSLKGIVCLPAKTGDAKGKCTAINVGATGDACGAIKTGDTIKVTLCKAGACETNTKKCVADFPEGAPCVLGQDECQAPAKCRNGLCTVLDSATCK